MYVYNEPIKLTSGLWQCRNWLAKLKFKLSRRLRAFDIPRLANMSVTLSYLAHPKKRFTCLLKHGINSCRVRDSVHNAEPKKTHAVRLKQSYLDKTRTLLKSTRKYGTYCTLLQWSLHFWYLYHHASHNVPQIFKLFYSYWMLERLHNDYSLAWKSYLQLCWH